MKLLLIRHLWGVAGSWEELFPKFKAWGYHGIEAGVPPQEDQERLRRLLDEHGLEYVAQIFTQGGDVRDHVQSFETQLKEAHNLRPRLVNAHSGQDAWAESESVRFFREVLQLESVQELPVAHETHRGRILYNPWITQRLLDRFADLKLCCDYSHWVCVCERLIEDQGKVLRECAARCLHLHARVGYEQGPQVPDPRAPEYLGHLEAHERWWAAIWDAQMSRGDLESTLTPEFGPVPYLHSLPFTNAPVADLWEVCDWQARRQAENFARRFAARSGGGEETT
jgi:sugar phosphate isomerase/epimerase